MNKCVSIIVIDTSELGEIVKSVKLNCFLKTFWSADNHRTILLYDDLLQCQSDFCVIMPIAKTSPQLLLDYKLFISDEEISQLHSQDEYCYALLISNIPLTVSDAQSVLRIINSNLIVFKYAFKVKGEKKLQVLVKSWKETRRLLNEKYPFTVALYKNDMLLNHIPEEQPKKNLLSSPNQNIVLSKTDSWETKELSNNHLTQFPPPPIKEQNFMKNPSSTIPQNYSQQLTKYPQFTQPPNPSLTNFPPPTQFAPPFSYQKNDYVNNRNNKRNLENSPTSNQNVALEKEANNLGNESISQSSVNQFPPPLNKNNFNTQSGINQMNKQHLANLYTKPVAGNPIITELPSNPIITELPSNPIISKLPSNPIISKLPSNPIISKLPSNPIISKLPSNPIFSKLPPNPTSRPSRERSHIGPSVEEQYIVSASQTKITSPIVNENKKVLTNVAPNVKEQSENENKDERMLLKNQEVPSKLNFKSSSIEDVEMDLEVETENKRCKREKEIDLTVDESLNGSPTKENKIPFDTKLISSNMKLIRDEVFESKFIDMYYYENLMDEFRNVNKDLTVKITSIDSLTSFWIQCDEIYLKFNKNYQVTYPQYHKILTELRAVLSDELSEWKLSLGKFKNLNKYSPCLVDAEGKEFVRGMIVERGEKISTIFSVDFGGKFTANNDVIYIIDSEWIESITSQPPFAIPVIFEKNANLSVDLNTFQTIFMNEQMIMNKYRVTVIPGLHSVLVGEFTLTNQNIIDEMELPEDGRTMEHFMSVFSL
ncbi:hypothetical protein SNEBB_008264 [Seison nebaliae]|nr:hypothetical protein SNEBB_008264 [Seison nebaliae]